MISTYISISKNTACQVWRQRAFWIAQAILAMLLLLNVLRISVMRSAYPASLTTDTPGLFTLALYYLLIPIIVVPIILADFGKVGEILWSSPADSIVHFLGLFSGLYLGLLPSVLLQLGILFLANLFWPTLLPPSVWLVSLGIYLLATFLGLSITLLGAALLRRSLSLMLILVVLWLWMYVRIIFLNGLSEEDVLFSKYALSNIFFHNLALSPSLGLGLMQDQTLGLFAWLLGFGLAIGGLALLLAPVFDSRRSARWYWLPWLVLGLGLFAAVGGYQLNRHAVQAHAISVSPYQPQIDVWEVISQNTQVEVDAASGLISGSARMQYAPLQALDRPVIILRLNPGLALTAANETGQLLTVERLGDSVSLALTELPKNSITMNLTWQGRLQIPFDAYEQKWSFPDAPFPWNINHMPALLKAYIQPDGGFILRDGDWMPWPWTTSTHQARENILTIHAVGGEFVASSTVQNETATWQDQLPVGLLAFLPGKQIQSDQVTLAASQIAGPQQTSVAAVFAKAAKDLEPLLGVPLPRHVIVTPYLNDLVWDGDLLLVPDGGGEYISTPVRWLYNRDRSNSHQPIFIRAAVAALARTFLLKQAPPIPLGYQSQLIESWGNPNTVLISGVSEQNWQQNNGRWIQVAEYFDVKTTWDPRRAVAITPQGEWSAVAFWIAMEMTDETTRKADLDLIDYFEGPGKSILFSNQGNKMHAELDWPEVLTTGEGRSIVLKLHQWAETLGSKKALALLVAEVKENKPDTVEALFHNLEISSGVQIGEVQP